jgi:lipopolysaccharide transport system ATP-binding protein
VIESFSIRDGNNALTDMLACGEAVTFGIGYSHSEAVARVGLGIVISKPDVGNLVALQTHVQHGPLDKLPPSGVARCHVPRLRLTPGSYTLSIGITTGGEQLDWIERCVELEILPQDVYGTGRLPKAGHGPVVLDADWSFS